MQIETLCQLWPQAKRRNALRIMAMLSVGALSLAIDAWAQSGGKQFVEKHLRDAFAYLKTEI